MDNWEVMLFLSGLSVCVALGFSAGFKGVSTMR